MSPLEKHHHPNRAKPFRPKLSTTRKLVLTPGVPQRRAEDGLLGPQLRNYPMGPSRARQKPWQRGRDYWAQVGGPDSTKRRQCHVPPFNCPPPLRRDTVPRNPRSPDLLSARGRRPRRPQALRLNTPVLNLSAWKSLKRSSLRHYFPFEDTHLRIK